MFLNFRGPGWEIDGEHRLQGRGDRRQETTVTRCWFRIIFDDLRWQPNQHKRKSKHIWSFYVVFSICYLSVFHCVTAEGRLRILNKSWPREGGIGKRPSIYGRLLQKHCSLTSPRLGGRTVSVRPSDHVESEESDSHLFRGELSPQQAPDKDKPRPASREHREVITRLSTLG